MKFAFHNLLSIAVATALLSLLASRTATSVSARGDDNVLLLQSQADADRKSAGCLTCHTSTDSPTMHATGTVRLGCTDCHGGNSEVRLTSGSPQNSAAYAEAKRQAHPQRSNPKDAHSSANPERAYTELVEGRLGLRAVRKSWRLARSRKNLRHFGLSHRRSTQSSDEHDDARRHVVGRGALQQRCRPIQDSTVRRELRPRRQPAAANYVSATDARRNQQEGNSSLSRSDPALGNFPARKCAARI